MAFSFLFLFFFFCAAPLWSFGQNRPFFDIFWFCVLFHLFLGVYQAVQPPSHRAEHFVARWYRRLLVFFTALAIAQLWPLISVYTAATCFVIAGVE
jgi:hypothetical protein